MELRVFSWYEINIGINNFNIIKLQIITVQQFFKFTIIIILCLSLNGCINAGSPFLQKLFKEGPDTKYDLFTLGWKHGCETGFATSGNNFYKFRYKYRQDSRLFMNSKYYKGWRSAWTFCQRYLFQWAQREAF